MEQQRVVFVKSQLSRGGFPSECLFHVHTLRGDLTAAPIHYCYDDNGKPLREEIPAGEKRSGYVAGVEIQRQAGDTLRVYLADGEVYDVSENQIRHPAEVSDRVPVQS